MYPTTQEKAAIQAAEKLMNDTMARYDPSHDAYHVERVRKTALNLAHSLPNGAQPDLLVIEIAALLHDVLDKKYVTPAEAADPYAFFLPFFRSIAEQPAGVDLVADGRARLIANVIENVSWTTEKKLRAEGRWTEWHETCRELHCVQDADRLDAIGAFGIMRCAAFSSVTNRPLHAPPGRTDTAVEHFYDKLLHIQDRLKTEPGKKMGAKRHQLMLDFLEAIKEESDEAR
ncbi:hypothetical protein CONPUDRAFT_163243 [Coniophora puteana RWD-64-598 SS2]|uniref:HD/PDEase domain-containing protein n=1 Tax=Coniophora puteana (strain RWD-64-598) TaxID=741705 RepID=A0A5M3MYX2_CONPW|nr:uncharacterized protein CONPUDRAFT_163243 [Coniophora puteana RWD-64-598 SS2]EIW83994.1 hypothetical protein CONPUDRAFT_163243 [Coniophora puteana RWD-64-598 SS2]